ncbi:MAG: Gfo/Idh/MocA family oxidoreductase [Thermomicrobiales bacterium]|nr:Gfo/Idh/MocA family oxidoreductase [Thermomicrobiales bacterium]
MTIRFGLAGLRHPHLEYLLTEIAGRPGEVEIVALAEDDPAIRQQFQARLGVPAYADYREMFAETRLDAVGVIAVNNAKAAIVVDALEAGLHVIGDKPLCTSLEDLDRIEAAWRASDRQFSMLLDKRFYPPTLVAKEVLDSGELGDLALAWASGPHRLRRETRPDWMFRHASYGGVLNDLCIHDIDLLLWLSGAESGQVQGLAGNRAHPDLPEFQDYGHVQLRLGEGAIATSEAHWFSPEAAPYHGDYRMILTGTKGTAELRWVQNELMVATNERAPELRPLPPAGSVAGDFFDALLENREPSVKAHEVLTATRVALLAQTYANSGAWQSWSAVRPR